MTNTNKGILLSLITALFWGVLAIALKVAVQKVDPFTIVWFRYSFAFSVLFIWFLIFNRSRLRILIKPPLSLVIATLALAVNYIGFMLGVKYTSPSNAQVIIQIGPILLALIGIIFFHEKIEKIQLFGFIVVIGGFILFYSQQLKSLFLSHDDFNKGVLFTVMGALSWTVYAVIQKKLVIKHHPQTLNLYLYALPTLLYLPLATFKPLTELSIGWWSLIIFLGVNTVVAYGCMNAALKYLDANKVSSIIVSNPVITFLLMAIFTSFNVPWIEGEHFTALTWTGAFLFLGGAFIVVKKWRHN